jgi:thiamine-monophosphate kinase
MSQLSEIGEDAIVERLVEKLADRCEEDRRLIVGPGDDCAVVNLNDSEPYQLLKTDSMVEGVHYRVEDSATKVGWKAVARVVSDFAAMGGLPSYLLITVAMPAHKPIEYLENLYEGMQYCASKYGATICGGETSSVPDKAAAVISVAATGWVEKSGCILRSGGQAGDLVMVTGNLGGSITGKHLSFTPRVVEARWLTKHFKINCMMDLSDGLGCDLPRLASASQCGYMVNEHALPCNEGCSVDEALGDGEDYELLFTISPEVIKTLSVAWSKQFPDLRLSLIGELLQTDDNIMSSKQGWQHFKSH